MTVNGPNDAHAPTELNAAPGAPSTGHGERTNERSDDNGDLALVRRAQNGDRAAFRKLYDLYHRRVYQMAVAMLRSHQDANDVVQEAFVRVHRHLPDFQGNSSFYTWLYRIGLNLVYDQLRRRKTQRQVDYDDTLARAEEGTDQTNLTPVIDGADPGRTASRKELAEKIQAALTTLPEHHRQVILLREVEGLSYEEIAKIMNVPKGTIMSRLFHARRKMQRALASYVEGELKPQDDEGDEA